MHANKQLVNGVNWSHILDIFTLSLSKMSTLLLIKKGLNMFIMN